MSLDHELKSEAQKGIEAHLIKRVLSETCRKHANSIVDADIAFEPKGTNVFVGIGLATQNRISAGLGLGIIPMACVAADIQADMRRMGLASSLVVLIADQHALAKHSDPPKTAEIHRVAESVQKSAERLKILYCEITKIIKKYKPETASLIDSTNPEDIKIDPNDKTDENETKAYADKLKKRRGF